jgi:GDPmannose 4,6-dehydratase
MTKRTAVITGVTGQDGSYLAELLLSKGYAVKGLARRSSIDNHYDRVKHLVGEQWFDLIEGDVSDTINVSNLIQQYKPSEFYNLAAQSHVQTSFAQPSLTFNVNTHGVLNILEAIRQHSPNTRFYQASTSEMFGSNVSFDYDVQGCAVRYDGPMLPEDSNISRNRYGCDSVSPQSTYDGIFQDEDTPFAPQSPYAVSKAAAHHLTQLYRKAYKIHASCGILFNHESERRGVLFVTRKITKWIGEYMKWFPTQPRFEQGQLASIRIVDDPSKIYVGIYDKIGFPKLKLGNLEALRDWGHAEDYVKAMHLMVWADAPDDYVVATGKSYTIKEFLEAAFRYVSDTYGVGVTIGIDSHVMIDPAFVRPAEVNYLLGNTSKIRSSLFWEPQVRFGDLVKRMVDHDISQAQKTV